MHVGMAVAVHELLTYPLDRVATRYATTLLGVHSITGKPGSSSRRLLYLAELDQILNHDKSRGLYQGLKSRLDLSITKTVLRYFTFQYLYFRYVYKEYYSSKFTEEAEVEGDITPDDPNCQPLLRYARSTDLKLLGVAAIANLIGVIASHPINVLRVKIQCEPLGDQVDIHKRYNDKMKDISKYHGTHKVWIKTAFISRYLYTYLQFVAEMSLFQSCLNKCGFEFINVYKRHQQSTYATKFNVFLSVVGSTFVTQTALQPLYMYYHRNCMSQLQKLPSVSPIQFIKNVYKNEGIGAFSKGYLPNLMRCISRNLMIVGFLWHNAAQANLDRFRPIKE